MSRSDSLSLQATAAVDVLLLPSVLPIARQSRDHIMYRIVPYNSIAMIYKLWILKGTDESTRPEGE